MVEKRSELINQFIKRNIISKSEKFADTPKKIADSILKESEQESEKESDQSIPKRVQVTEERFEFIKLKINKNKHLSTKIDNKRYTLNDANNLVNKIAD